MTYAEIAAILKDISYKPGWRFYIGEDGDGLWFQLQFEAPDLVTGETSEQHGRKWKLSEHMTVSEVVTTVLKAILTAEEHEAREAFRYKGVSIFTPHLDVEALVGFASKKAFLDMRTGGWVKES